MSEFAGQAPAVGPETKRRCTYCGGPAEGATALTPDVCFVCRDSAPVGPPWQPGEVGYEVSMSAERAELLSGIRPRVDPFVVGPLRCKATAEELARVWGATVTECVPVPPTTHPVGGELVTVE